MLELFGENKELLFGIFSGLIVAALLYLFGKIKKLLPDCNPINVLSKSKIIHIYENREKANKQILKDAERSGKIFILSHLETSLEISGEFYELLKNKKGEIKFMFIKQDSEHTLMRRGEELDHIISREKTIDFIKTIKKLQTINKYIELKLHNEFIRNKFYIFDDVMYLFFRLKYKTTDQSQVYRIGKNSILYNSFCLQFFDYWNKYHIIELEKEIV